MPAESIDTLVQLMEEIRTQLKCLRNYKESTRSLVHMMDFFVNDMLDCAVLNSKDKNFVKCFTCFDVRVATQ